MRGLRAFNRKCKIEISGGMNRPPMERTAGVAALYAQAKAIARELGWNLGEAAVAEAPMAISRGAGHPYARRSWGVATARTPSMSTS